MNSVLRVSPGCNAKTLLAFVIAAPVLSDLRDLHFKHIPPPPYGTHAILIVNPDAVLPGAAPSKSFQLIPRRHLQVVQRYRGIQNGKFLERSSLQVGGKPSALSRLPQPFCFLVPETRNHVRTIIFANTTVTQYYCITLVPSP